MAKKVPVKSEKIEIRLSKNQKEEIRELTALSGKKSISEFIIDTVFNTLVRKSDNAIDNDILVLLKKHFSEVHDFQNQQKETMYIIMQFAMLSVSEAEPKSVEEIMEFFEDASQKAKKKFSEGSK